MQICNDPVIMGEQNPILMPFLDEVRLIDNEDYAQIEAITSRSSFDDDL